MLIMSPEILTIMMKSHKFTKIKNLGNSHFHNCSLNFRYICWTNVIHTKVIVHSKTIGILNFYKRDNNGVNMAYLEFKQECRKPITV